MRENRRPAGPGARKPFHIFNFRPPGREGERNMKKRLISMALALCLALTLCTGLAAPASAAGADRRVGFLVSYTFQAGDTVYDLCEKRGIDFATNYQLIAKINNITNFNYMMPGRVLWLPSQTATTDAAYYTLLAHILVAGETPAGLCQSYGIDYNANYNLLAALNTNMTTFMAGQQFILPLYVAPAGQGNASTPAPSAGTATPAPSAGAATPAPSAGANGGTAAPAPTAAGAAGDTVSYYLAQHVLQGGETVSGICAALGVDFMQQADAIQRINDIVSFNYMLPGKTLLIPVNSVPTSGSYYKVMAHKIVAGDTVYNLCASYGLAFDAYSSMIAKLNNRENLASFYVGETLYMPLYVAAPTTQMPPAPAPSAGAQATPTPAAGTQPTPTPGAGAQPSPSAGVTLPDVTAAPVTVPEGDTLEYLIIPHVLQAGETVSGICAELGVDFMSNYDRIMRLSNITNYNYLLPGKEILIPSTAYPASGPYYKIMKHTLVAGDTVYDLCLKYGLNYNNNIAFLQRLNDRNDMASFYVGQVIYMPLYVAG